MNPNESTLKIDIEPNGHNGDEPGSSETDAWWFGARERIVAPRNPRPLADPVSERSANRVDSPTVGPPTTMDVSDLKPVARQRPYFGKRGFAPVYQWEGVVEEVNGEGFRARLRPFEKGQADASRIEYADFEYDDLADDSDHDLVTEGAVFYWTVGKSRNPAGTYTNTSLVRFRRLPPPTAHQIREAGREAAALIADLGDDQ
jgi:hypothetical protein